jgi:hypothetical protein
VSVVADRGVAVAGGTRPHPAVFRAGRVVAFGLAFGLTGQLLFFDVGIGLNYPLALALLLCGGWIGRQRSVARRGMDLVLPIAALVLATFVAIRADPSIVMLDVLASLVLAGAALVSWSGTPVVTQPAATIVRLGALGVSWVAGGAGGALRAAYRSHEGARPGSRRFAPLLPYLRGLVLALPVIAVFLALFSAADAVFADALADLFHLDVDSLLGRVVMAAVLGWLATGALALAATPYRSPAGAGTAPVLAWRLGSTEAAVIVTMTLAVFSAFAAVQAAYLFGGLDTVAAAGITYAEYARRGFFELVAVAVLAGALVVATDRMVARRTVVLLAASVALVVVTAVVLASAVLRMRLYQEAYGWTELRLYVVAAIIVIAVALGTLVLLLLRNRVRWIGHAVVTAGFLAGVALNVIGPVRFVTEQNVARLLDPSLVPQHGRHGLDEGYAWSLGDDAVPALLDALPHLDDPYETLGWSLRGRLDALRAEDLVAWQAWNLGRHAAREALRDADDRGALPTP